MPQDYNATINLPKTDFPMRAGLPKREPELLQTFYEKRIYENLMSKNAGNPAFILHDGPPFSNGDIHIGTAMNKVIKDIIIRYKNMSGWLAPYTPGWDNHGMPIESAIIKKNKLDRKMMSIPEFRDACREFAENYVDRQREQFKRLGVIGDWDRPYLTMVPSFEAEEVRVFGKMYEKGYIYKGLKPVYWCTDDETALAEAEIEYDDEPCTAIFVKFPVKDAKGVLDGIDGADKACFLIWTTTAWTLPGNLAICLGPDIEYAVCAAGGDVFIIAASLAEAVFKQAGIAHYDILKKLPGTAFELMTAQHPFYDRESLVILGDHVTTEAGTGCVHTAPGHGADDFVVCSKYPQLPVMTPVDPHGVMTADALQYEGMYYSKAGSAIIEDLQKSGALFASEEIVHSYPHCWRCKNPVIFRATEQWFASVDAMKEAAVKACEDIRWIPEWGKERMIAMLIERSDWCISRQRHWGLPIPVFMCEECEQPVCTPETIEAVAALFGEKGSNAWHEMDAADILPKGFACPHCGATHFTKGADSLDCWFDSGSTHAGVLSTGIFPHLHYPADIYLEGGDQYRGWFQSSMLTSIAVNGIAPYKIIITHGWTVDGEGKAMHKSLGNAVAPDEIIKDFGADILRLWVASTDYRADSRISRDILKQLSDIYLKIRNTARFMLGNLNNFDPDDLVGIDDMPDLDRWALARLDKLIAGVNASYEKYEFHTIYHAIHNFCTIDMSNFYLDVIKDRLYCDETNGLPRRSAQTVMYRILDALVRILAPILAFTAEEIWGEMPHDASVERDSVLYNRMPASTVEHSFSAEQEALWDKLLRLRSDVNKALELARADKIVGKPLDADVTLFVGDDAAAALGPVLEMDLKTLFIVSSVSVVMSAGAGVGSSAGAGASTDANADAGAGAGASADAGAGADANADAGAGVAGSEFPSLSISIVPSAAPKCSRCWVHDKDVGKSSEHPELCPRCLDVVTKGL
ncbi:MAG: isoleucine--tRNA ligase [Oscillospiraceae bacterium]|nr:isoleucine--tRNA ligase [Oscillospiraceae bacterium]